MSGRLRVEAVVPGLAGDTRRDGLERASTELKARLAAGTWDTLEPTSRALLTLAEALTDAEPDPTVTPAIAATAYTKAVETELNALLFPALRRVLSNAPVEEREVRVGDASLDLGDEVFPQSLGSLRLLLERTPLVARYIPVLFPRDAEWMLRALPARLAVLAEIASLCFGPDPLHHELVQDVRDELFGRDGEPGLLEALATAKTRGT